MKNSEIIERLLIIMGEKIGLVTATNVNYGSNLQSYALYMYLTNKGYSLEVIEYKKTKTFKQLVRIFNFTLVKEKLKYLYRDIYCRFFMPKVYLNMRERSNLFMDFKDQHFNLSEVYVGEKALKEGARNYKVVILGSDQLWNPVNLGADFATLSFVQDGTLTITYAPSFGVSSIPFYQKNRTCNYLKRIDYISVREESGKKIIKDLVGRDVPVVCDPTILVDKMYWSDLKGERRIIEGEYILCYFLGRNKKHREFASRLRAESGLKIVSLLYIDDFVKDDYHFADITPFDIGPAEFVNLISNASYVLTDSFHGTIFSILYEKKFFSFSRFSEKSKSSTNSRIDFLLQQIGIPERKLTGAEEVSKCLSLSINYSQVEDKLNQFRKFSRQYLENALSNVRM
ncbi:MAG: polysaccharide pyruvyl transferase family protein [Desulfobacter postgatei]|uniref:polysaccharide pyruvyl transferase family protein n=1 Tax=Desulfobacter postgatei TaxID=2293 RepID=UPI0023F12E3C|nr:polysaccharide pyruvyl transferase family protein [Desulfobacter postgatei]MDD4274333.1 polysaccharide pyruvyl transferase family protein [Desulfobacter postgatei]